MREKYPVQGIFSRKIFSDIALNLLFLTKVKTPCRAQSENIDFTGAHSVGDLSTFKSAGCGFHQTPAKNVKMIFA
jgi:hypothetical protein